MNENIRGKKILIIEDELPMLRLLNEACANENMAVLEARDGAEGLKMALAHRPDIILLDIVLPVMDGMMVLKKIREDEWGARVPIILLTNLNADEKIMKGVVTHEPSYYLVKTEWQIEDVVKKVKECLAEQ